MVGSTVFVRSTALLVAVFPAFAFARVAQAQEAHEGTGESQSAFPPFDPATFGSTLFWLLVTFVTLYWLMSRIALPRVGGIIEHRNATIGADLEIADAMQKKAEAAGAAYTTALSKARANAVTIGQQAKDAASAAATERRKAVEAEVASKIATAEQQIATMKASAMTSVAGIATDAAGAIVERLIGVAPSESDVHKAIADTLAG